MSEAQTAIVGDSVAQAAQAELTNATTGGFLSEAQKAHAIRRVRELADAQKKKFRVDNPTPFPTKPVTSIDQKFEMVRDGVAKPIDLKGKKKACQLPGGDNTTWVQMFTFPDTEDQKAHDAVVNKVRTYCNAVDKKLEGTIDQIVLGTGAKVLVLLAEFGPDAADPTKPAPK